MSSSLQTTQTIQNFLMKLKNSNQAPLQMNLPYIAFSPAEVLHTITTFPKRKSPGFDIITIEIVKNLPKKTIILLTYIYNGTLRLAYFPTQWELSVIIIIPKSWKPPESPASYRPISLLPLFSKVLKKLILNRINPIINTSNIILNTQFSFWKRHSTIQQINRITDVIASSSEKKILFCSISELKRRASTVSDITASCIK
jgi:hypothetical protein